MTNTKSRPFYGIWSLAPRQYLGYVESGIGRVMSIAMMILYEITQCIAMNRDREETLQDRIGQLALVFVNLQRIHADMAQEYDDTIQQSMAMEEDAVQEIARLEQLVHLYDSNMETQSSIFNEEIQRSKGLQETLEKIVSSLQNELANERQTSNEKTRQLVSVMEESLKRIGIPIEEREKAARTGM